ncbi:MAG: 4'-phosphopantetheinyl transferase superfamily protein [Firmicutes bacterium]|nr:4'-phosphopantetheinyl transferase superfamily protein [Bacillota bacterium]
MAQGEYRLAWAALAGGSGHEAAWALLARLYREETGEALPETAVTALGKPYFPAGGLHFSLSHCRTHAFCCLSRHNIGIDAEDVQRQIPPAVGERFLSPGEKRRAAAAQDPAAALLRLWVLKEAYAKCTGQGLGAYLRGTDFTPDDPRITTIDGCYVAVVEE